MGDPANYKGSILDEISSNLDDWEVFKKPPCSAEITLTISSSGLLLAFLVHLAA